MGRFFDRLCSVAERQYPSKALKGYLKRASLLALPEGVAGVADRDKLVEGFRLPFPVTVVEDAVSCVMVVDTNPDQIGLRCERVFVECSSALPDEGDEEVERLREVAGQGLPREAVQVIVSRITDVRGGSYVAEMGFGLVASKTDLHMHPDSFKASALSSGWWAELEIAAAKKAQEIVEAIADGQAERWINEVPPSRPRSKKQRNGPEFLRTHERPHYMLRTAEEMDAE